MNEDTWTAMPVLARSPNGRLTGIQFYREMTSAEMAKIRLHGIVAQDRKACESGRWKLVWLAYENRWLDSPNFFQRKWSKCIYRWTTRR